MLLLLSRQTLASLERKLLQPQRTLWTESQCWRPPFRKLQRQNLAEVLSADLKLKVIQLQQEECCSQLQHWMIPRACPKMLTASERTPREKANLIKRYRSMVKNKTWMESVQNHILEIILSSREVIRNKRRSTRKKKTVIAPSPVQKVRMIPRMLASRKE